jgi:uncharacterized membrane protein (UPF0182 family)
MENGRCLHFPFNDDERSNGYEGKSTIKLDSFVWKCVMNQANEPKDEQCLET